jgi:hypothetical protein
LPDRRGDLRRVVRVANQQSRRSVIHGLGSAGGTPTDHRETTRASLEVDQPVALCVPPPLNAGGHDKEVRRSEGRFELGANEATSEGHPVLQLVPTDERAQAVTVGALSHNAVGDLWELIA